MCLSNANIKLQIENRFAFPVLRNTTASLKQPSLLVYDLFHLLPVKFIPQLWV